MSISVNFRDINYQDPIDERNLEEQIRLFDPSQESGSERTPIRSSPSTPTVPGFARSRRGSNESNYPIYSEEAMLSGRFPYALVMKVSSSEPRDVLQSERTCLTFIRFSTSLFFVALGVILNFKLHTSSDDQDGGGDEPSRGFSNYSFFVAMVLMSLAVITLIVSGIDYFVTIKRYAKHKIKTYNFNNLTTIFCVTSIIITLLGINISLIVDQYIKES